VVARNWSYFSPAQMPGMTGVTLPCGLSSGAVADAVPAGLTGVWRLARRGLVRGAVHPAGTATAHARAATTRVVDSMRSPDPR
jgi:hypothetical protein